MKKLCGMMALILCALLLMPAFAAGEAAAGFSVDIIVPDNYEGELNGRVLLALDKQMPEEGDQLYEYLDVTSIPVFGKTVFGLKAGDTINLSSGDAGVNGWPFQMGELPPGEYAVQAFFIVYTKFERAQAPAIWGMADHGGGGYFGANPYNLYSAMQMADLRAGGTELTLDQMIPLGYELKEGQVTQQGNYEDTEMVKYVKIKSELLSDFWGTDMYLGANVLLPKDYSADKTYPVLYYQGHWPGSGAPLSYGRTGRDSYEAFNKFWDESAPDLIVVTFRDANMFYDTSYSVDSVNLGPWGEAITTELIPWLEETFNAVGEPWARALAGGSTGGWESLAMQVFYPEYFGGTWAMCPDGVDFHAYQIVNLYDDENAYYLDKGWYKVARPSSRDLSGNIKFTIEDENHYELAIGGPEAVSLGQWAVWESVYGPMKDNGYPARVWDPVTGVIDKEVVAYWGENYDLTRILQTEWEELGPKLKGKIHLRGGDMDSYYLNLAQYILGDWLATTDYEGYSVTFPRMGHTGNISNPDLVTEIALHMVKYGPENAADILGINK